MFLGMEKISTDWFDLVSVGHYILVKFIWRHYLLHYDDILLNKRRNGCNKFI